jgi:hypothetical protein
VWWRDPAAQADPYLLDLVVLDETDVRGSAMVVCKMAFVVVVDAHPHVNRDSKLRGSSYN